MLRWHAEAHPERVHLFLREEDGTERALAHGALWAEASAVVGRAMRQSGHVLVDRYHAAQATADAERATQLLRKGTSLLFFPEGTTAKGPALLPFDAPISWSH